MRHVSALAMAAAAAMAGIGQSAEVMPRDMLTGEPIRPRGRVSTAGAYGSGERRHGPNPPGTKLVRRFIRHSGKESLYWRELYKQMTGERYD